ncbi:AMP-binding protein, partial [Eubacteriales bacterium OttesenSCG-928-N13]|nr:AMP-binding protein [Eubacteriales bacterium OttesenSCG-928-N13]
MKISFSTLGCPDFSWPEIYSMAKDFGFDGIEVRGIGSALNALDAEPFRPAQMDKTIRKLKDLGLTIPCLSTGCSLAIPELRAEAVAEITGTIELAKKLGAKYIRILADTDAPVLGEVDDQDVIDTLKRLARFAEDTGITLLCETNGVYADTARLRRLLDAVGSPCVAALWDMHHPYRFFGESPETTIKNLNGYIRHTHVKDSVMEQGKPSYRMLGDGDLPLADMMNALVDYGYSGYVSLEWVKRWAPGLEEAGVVFPQFANYMQPWRDKQPEAPEAQVAHGYMFPKEHLIDLTFPQLLKTMAETHPDNIAVRYTALDYTRTYREFKQDVDNFARALIAMGVKPGDHVAIWATNVPAWYLTFWATVEIGAVLVTVNTAYKIHEAEYLLRQSDTHTLVMTDGVKGVSYPEIMMQLCPELAESKPGELVSAKLPRLKNVISVDSPVDGCYSWAQALSYAEQVPMTEIDRRIAAIDVHDVCNMQYTSGTTGFPKGVMLTHYNVVNNGKAIGDCMELTPDDRLLIHVPMFHCFGMVLAMTAAVTHGTGMYPMPVFSPSKSL